MRRLVSLLLGSVLFPLVLSARPELPLPYRVFPPLQGQRVHGVYADSRNKLWIGTDNGLYAYDGICLSHYTTGDGLDDNEVLEFWGENAGRLWIRTHTNRLCFVDLHSGKICNSEQIPALKIRSPFITKSVSFGPGGEVYVLSDALHITLLYPGTWRVCSLPAFRMPRHLYQPLGGQPILLQGYSEVKDHWFYQLKGTNWQPLATGREFISCEHERLLYLFSPASHSIYQWTDTGLLLLHRLPATRDKMLKFFVFSKDCMALLSHQQLMLLKDGRARIYPCKGLNGLARDRNGNLWLATDEGLCRVPAYHDQVAAVHPDAGLSFLSLYRRGDSLVPLAGKGNLMVKDDGTVRWTAFLPTGSYWQVGIELRRHSMPSALSRTVAGVFKELVTTADTAYLRTDRSLLKLYPSAQGLRADTLSAARRHTAMYLRSSGELWYATLDSLYCRKGDSTQRRALPGSHVVKIISAIGPFILVSNGDHFIHAYTAARNRYQTYSLPGQPGHYLAQIFDIDSNRKFFRTNEHLYLLEWPPAGLPRWRTIENLEPELCDIRDIRLSGEQVYLLTPDACYRYPLSVLTATQPPPVPRPERLWYQVEGGLWKSLPLDPRNRQAALPSCVKSYRMTFSVDAINQRQAEVDYALSRQGDRWRNWQRASGNEVLVSLPRHGSTRLSLRSGSASSGFGPVVYCDIRIAPSFWYDYRFIAACVLLGIALFVFIAHLVFRRYARRKEAKLAQEMQSLQNEFRALNAMMNPHFIFNSLNSIQGFINTDDKKSANRYLLHFSRLIRQNMVNISGNLIPVRQELDVLRHYLEIERLRLEDRLQYSLRLDREATGHFLLPPLLIQPLAENAILHGLLPVLDRQQELHITVEHREGMLYITVRDNGIGYYNARKRLPDRPSFGISYIRKRLEKIEVMTHRPCRFTILSEPGQPGTTILISLPAQAGKTVQ